MTDRWEREVGLQKAYGLSQTESAYAVCSADGMTAAAIASHYGVSGNTVRAILQRGRRKMKRKRKTMIAIVKGNPDRQGVAVKLCATRALMCFVTEIHGIAWKEGAHVLMAELPDEQGDAQWVKDNVFRYVDVFCTMSPGEAERRGKDLAERYRTALPPAGDGGEPPAMLGSATVMRLLDEMYMQYDTWEGNR